MAEKVIPKSTYYKIFAVLMLLLIATIGVAYIDLGPWNIVAAMSIAVTKAVLVILFFMHVKYNTKLTWVFVTAGFFWFGIMIAFTMADYLARRGTW